MITPPPKLNEVFSSPTNFADLLRKSTTPEFQQVLGVANKNYLHWHKFRYYRPMPEGVYPEELWAFLKLGREANKKLVPFTDKNGEPFTYWIPDSLFQILHEVDLWTGGMITADRPDSLPSKEKYIISSLMEEAIASSQLEGAATTRQVAKEMLRSGRKPKDKSERMILNNWETMKYIRGNRNAKFTPEKLLELHRIITAETMQDQSEAGTFRNRDDIVVEYHGETVHIPPKASTLDERMRKLCHFANNDNEEPWIHPVFKGIMIHFWLAYDHPFTDGNGRTARALMYWYLLSRKYILFEYLAISRYIRNAPARYVQAYLFTETDGNDLTYFLIYNLKAIRRAIIDLRKYIERKQQEVTASQSLLKNLRSFNPRQTTLVHHAIRHPDALYTIEAHKSYHGIVYQTARQDLLTLVKRGFLRKEKQGKEFVFSPSTKMVEKFGKPRKKVER